MPSKTEEIELIEIELDAARRLVPA